MNDGDETYIMLLLTDSNLPTGSFVASSGLESSIAHGFSSLTPSPLVTFIQDSLPTYARSTLPFVSDAHRVVARYKEEVEGSEGNVKAGGLEEASRQLAELDELYDTMTLNHVAKRASKAQGVALLTLFSKGFSQPPSLAAYTDAESRDKESKMRELLDGYKFKVRREDVQGHLPICWGALAAALGLKLERTQYLHLFLHARSLLSAGVRLNNIGPYGAQQLLLHAVRPLLEAEVTKCKDLQTGFLVVPGGNFNEPTQGPANTWPLGEILSSRHDLQHSRIFNS
ncbi:hypothetical protein BDN72DRAFT_775110 [Pluteus cervinus]|uniref:Uncharacterized protein n=1 Tax=Pluteus cervinus TaxID=181527 RepID=A0ACD3AEL7_9AGAR|nr:hypothetical protein BDN72DRAFT_775110 [Pluteus cervinus]